MERHPPPSKQNVDATLSYTCNVFVGTTSTTGTPEFTNLPITSETKFSLPTTVTPGEKIPSVPVTVVNDFTGLIGAAEAIGATKAEGSSPDLAATYIVNNKSISSPLNNVTAPLATIPPLGKKWLDTATGTTSALTVPQNASGAILVDGPSAFTIESTLTSTLIAGGQEPTALTCTQVPGQDLTLARIRVNNAGITQVDATSAYSCDEFNHPTVPTDGTPAAAYAQLIDLESKLAVPSAVNPGGRIPATDLTMNGTLSGSLASIDALIRKADTLTVALSNAALAVAVNGQTSTSPLTGLTPTPAVVGTSGSDPFEDDATTSAITVAAGAAGDVALSAPQQFEADLTYTNPTGTVDFTASLKCAAQDGENLTLATIAVTPPPAKASITATNPKSTAFGSAVSVPVGISVPPVTPTPTQVGGSQNVDDTKQYKCNSWVNQTSVPTDGTAPTETVLSSAAEFQASLPAAVNPGGTIPTTAASLTWRFPVDTLFTVSSDVPDFAGVDKVSLPDYTLAAGVGGQTSSAPVTNLGSNALAPLPADLLTSSSGLVTTIPIETDGSTSAITVPTNAASDLTIQAPQQFTALATIEPNDAGTSAGVDPLPVAMQCTAGDPLALDIATVHVVRPTASKPTPTPTGKVLITTAAGRGVAQGTLVKGKANVVIPGTALPVGKSTLKVSYPGDSNTLAAPAKTITVVKTKASPSLAVHVTPGRVQAGAIFPTVNVRLSGPGKAKGGKITVTAEGTSKSTNLLSLDGTGSVQFAPFATAGKKVIRVSYAGNANFTAKTVTMALNVTKTGLGKFAVKVKPGKIIAKKTRATLLITLGAPDKLGHGLVTVRLAGRVIAKKVIAGAGKITLPKFASAGRKLLHLTFAGNASVVAKTVTHAVKVTKAPKHHRK